MKHLTQDELARFLQTQATGAFFEKQPVRWYGESPLAYASSRASPHPARALARTPASAAPLSSAPLPPSP